MRIHGLVLSSFLLCVAATSIARAAAPRIIAFQGTLATTGGVPRPDGHYTVSFKLFPTATGGAAVWTEPAKGVDVAGGKGLFTVTLGAPTAFGSLAFDQPYWLEVQVEGEAPMFPRLPLMSVPYALNASSSLTLPYTGSAAVATPGAVFAVTNNAAGPALQGSSDTYFGVLGQTETGTAVVGKATAGTGVYGSTGANGRAGVSGYNTYSAGGANETSDAIYGESRKGPGVHGVSTDGYGVFGQSAGGAGVVGKSGTWVGTYGYSDASFGVNGVSNTGTGVVGTSTQWIGVYGESAQFEGVRGVSNSIDHGGVVGINNAKGVAVYGNSPGGYGGYFEGRVRVGVLEIAGGSDVAEKFAVSGRAVPGTVVAIDPVHPGALRVAEGAYNRAVAGVISGAHNLNAGMVLPDARGAKGALPVAMTGRVWVRCTAAGGAITPGDMLTTSATPGRAMKVTDYTRAQGATIGKAMTGLESGHGLVLALVSLQ
jgi:hypothetical protein